MSAHAISRPRAAATSPSPWRVSMARWLGRMRERDDMARMTMRDMRDAGLTPYDVWRECAKPFWKE